MPELNISSHALLTMISRCLSGAWAIDPTWMFHHANLLLRADEGEDMSNSWPKMEAVMMQSRDGIYAAADPKGNIGKGQALGVINFTGPVYKYGWNSTKNLNAYLAMMAGDERVGGVKLIMDSPGGMVHGTREVYETIMNFPKPVLTVVDGYMASAGYYLGAGSSRIVASQPNDEIGSIGTYTTYADWAEFYSSFGLNLYEVYADASSEKNEDSRQIIDSKGEKTALAQQMVTAYNNQFLADVRTGRGDRLTGKGQDPMKGRLFMPAEGIENGLIDDLVQEKETLGVLADMVATNNKKSINMSLRSQLVALLSTEGDESTEQLSAQVDTLTKERDSANASLAAMTTERDGLQQQVSTLQGQVSTLTASNTALQAQVEELGEQPGAMGTTSKKDKDDQGDKVDFATKVKGYSHNQAADALFGK